MAKKMVHLPFSTTITLGTLADSTVVLSTILSGMTVGLYCHSVTANFAIRNVTPGEGPIEVGFSHGDLTTTEVKENLTANLSNPDNIISRERSSRPVRKVGQFPTIAADEVLANGVPVKRALRFNIGAGNDLKAWAYNRSGAALTTGATVTIDGTVHGRWK